MALGMKNQLCSAKLNEIKTVEALDNLLEVSLKDCYQIGIPNVSG